MPCLKIMTNIPRSKVPKDFVDRIIPILAQSVKKDESKFICVISPDHQLNMFGDNSSPGAVATLESIGNLGPEQNNLISRDVSDFVERELGVSPDRFFLTFYDLKPYNVGIFGSTVEDMVKKNKLDS